MESMISLPTPGQEKIVSVTTAKASVEPNSSPNTVTIGIEISRSTCRRRIVHSDRPAARANFTVSVSMTSRVPARARRIISASLNSDEVQRRQEQVLQPVAASGSSTRRRTTATVSPRPPAGSQPSSTAKMRIRTRPIQKVGTEKPRIETRHDGLGEQARRAGSRHTCRAARRCSVAPSTAASVSSSVAGRPRQDQLQHRHAEDEGAAEIAVQRRGRGRSKYCSPERLVEPVAGDRVERGCAASRRARSARRSGCRSRRRRRRPAPTWPA